MELLLILDSSVANLGIEIQYDLYNPTIINITCLRLEKRLDDNLRYLRDAPLEYSTFPFDMVPELRSPDAPVPVNPLKVSNEQLLLYSSLVCLHIWLKIQSVNDD